MIRGDLDWIVMKALEKDRTRRYETPSGLSADVLRFLERRAHRGRSPSLTYQFTKFARRNLATMVTSALVATLLVIGIVATSLMAQVAGGGANSRGRSQAEEPNVGQARRCLL